MLLVGCGVEPEEAFGGVSLGVPQSQVENIESYQAIMSTTIGGSSSYNLTYFNDEKNILIEIKTLGDLVHSVATDQIVQPEDVERVVYDMIEKFGDPEFDGRRSKSFEPGDNFSLVFPLRDSTLYEVILTVRHITDNWGDEYIRITMSGKTKKLYDIQKKAMDEARRALERSRNK